MNIWLMKIWVKHCWTRKIWVFSINDRKELQNIAINHSGDIDYNDFVKIYRECIKITYSFLTIDTMLPASDPLRFRKKLFKSYKNDSGWSD